MSGKTGKKPIRQGGRMKKYDFPKLPQPERYGIVKKVTENPKPVIKCEHCKFIESMGEPQDDREYWIITEIFIHLHGGADHCEISNEP